MDNGLITKTFNQGCIIKNIDLLYGLRCTKQFLGSQWMWFILPQFISKETLTKILLITPF